MELKILATAQMRSRLKFIKNNTNYLDKGKIMEDLLVYSPILIAVMVFLVQQRIIVTPEQLEKKHREIIDEIEDKFVSINSFKDLKDQFSEVKEKIDRMYDLLIDLK